MNIDIRFRIMKNEIHKHFCVNRKEYQYQIEEIPLTRDLEKFIKCLNVRLTYHTLFRFLLNIRLKYLLKFVDIVDRRKVLKYLGEQTKIRILHLNKHFPHCMFIVLLKRN